MRLATPCVKACLIAAAALLLRQTFGDDHRPFGRGDAEQRVLHDARIDGKDTVLTDEGNGPIAAYVDALSKSGVTVDVVDYREHAIKGNQGAKAQAAAYVEASVDGKALFGVGIDSNIVAASLKAITSAVNRARRP